MTRVVGITGGIATGKSNVSKIIHNYFKIPIIDADQITHNIQANNIKCQKQIVNYFGNSILDSNHKIDRNKLGKIVFNNKFKLKKLVQIMDPFIRGKIIDEIDNYSLISGIVILDAPTLFESGYEYLTDQIVVVKCNYMYQLKRLINRNHLSIADASAIINSQWPMEIKSALADFNIDTSGTVNQTKNQIKKLFYNNLLDC